MPLDTEVDFGLRDVVLDGDQGAQPSTFCPCLFWPNGWMDEDATWY